MATENIVLPVTSSVEPDQPPEQQCFYRQILEILNAGQIPYVISGGYALRFHTGIWRATKDLDIFLTPETASRALRILASRGFHCEVSDPVWLAKVHGSGYFVDLITGMSNGALRVSDSWIARATPATTLGVPTRVLAAEELLASKLFVTRRERFDGADIAHIIYGTRGNLDWNRIQEIAGNHWEILLWALLLFRYVYPAHSHYVPQSLWAQLLKKLMFALDNRDPKARFRGSLVDDKMFAIDVNEWGLDDLLSEYRAHLSTHIHWHPEADSQKSAA